MSRQAKGAPLVTGISPKSGPPGTRVTIRGENLGIGADDLIALRICGKDCLLSAQWKSPNKIIAHTAQARGLGDIIIATSTGGIGSCTVQFEGYVVQIGTTQESAVWIDETDEWMNFVNRNRIKSSLMSSSFDNPLGISDEADEKKFNRDLSEVFVGGSSSTIDENFEPAWYLLDNHHGTSFDDLKAGLNYLKRRSEQRQEGPIAFVKSNLTNFMDCQDTLADMHRQLVKDKEQCSEDDITVALENVLDKSNKAAVALFQDVLRRKDRADATRNALTVLHRFKFLFYLPCNIERNIKKGDYDLVITDYMRAKSLFGDTEVTVFKKVYQEVEKRVKDFRQMLHKQLLQLPAAVEEQKRLIRYLVHLEMPGNPAWECLECIQKSLLSQLHQCKELHINRDKEGEGVEKSDEEKSMTSPIHRLSKTQRESGFKTGSKAPQKVTFIEDLTKILLDNFPDLWHLGQAYFSGKLLKELKDKSSRVVTSKHPQYKAMVVDVITLFCNLVRAAFLPHTLENMDATKRQVLGEWRDNQQSPTAWLPISVRVIRSCVGTMSSFELSNDSMELLHELAFDMRTNCMATLFKQATEDIKALHFRETWTVDSDDEKGGTTFLPYLFENIVTEVIQQLHEVLLSKPGENEVFSQRPVQKEVVQLCIQLIEAFAGTLQQLAMIGNVEREVRSDPVNRTRAAVRPDLYAAGESGKMPTLDKRLLIMLSNAQHCREHIIQRITEHLEKHGYPETNTVFMITTKHYKELEEDLFEKYIEEKSNPIIGMLEQNMYAGRFDWNDCLQCTGVRRYIKEAIMSVIEVHAEVYSVNPHLVGPVMGQVVERVIDELARLIVCVTGFNRNGALQARLELYAMEVATAAYRTANTSSLLKEALDCLPKVTNMNDKKLLEELLNQFRCQMKLHLICLKPIRDDETY